MRWANGRRGRKLFLAMLALAIALLTIGATCVDRFVMHPTLDPRAAGHAARHAIAGPDGVVESFVSRSFDGEGEPELFVLAFTGNAQRAEDLADYDAERFRPRRAEAWTVNHPGYGGTAGPARLRSIAPNALAAYDAIAARARGRPVVVTGNSLGCTAALHVAAHRAVAGVIVQNPPALRQVILHQGWWNLWLIAGPASLRVPDALDAPANASRVTAPAIVITADADDRVMPKFQSLTFDALAGPKRRLNLRHKGHDDAIDSPAEWREFRALVDWMLPPPPASVGPAGPARADR